MLVYDDETALSPGGERRWEEEMGGGSGRRWEEEWGGGGGGGNRSRACTSALPSPHHNLAAAAAAPGPCPSFLTTGPAHAASGKPACPCLLGGGRVHPWATLAGSLRRWHFLFRRASLAPGPAHLPEADANAAPRLCHAECPQENAKPGSSLGRRGRSGPRTREGPWVPFCPAQRGCREPEGRPCWPRAWTRCPPPARAG